MWAVKLRAAEAIYFSLTKSGGDADQPIWQVVQLWQNSGQQVSLGWAAVPTTQQPLFEQWGRHEISPDQLSGQVVSPGRAAFLRQALRPGLTQTALGCPVELLGKIRDGEPLTADEEAGLPTGFRTSAESFERFADQVAASARLRRYNLRRLFRAHLVAEQTIAGNIVRFRREHAAMKLLIFLPNDALIDAGEIAAFVEQKLPTRQMILDRSHPLREPQPQLVQSGFGASPERSLTQRPGVKRRSLGEAVFSRS